MNLERPKKEEAFPLVILLQLLKSLAQLGNQRLDAPYLVRDNRSHMPRGHTFTMTSSKQVGK